MRTIAALRRVLSYEFSVAGLLETAMWLAVPHLFAGVVFAFLQPQYVDFFEDRWATVLPAGANLAGFGQTVALWPTLVFANQICAV
ncbi:hypothetical protein E4P42_23990 [Mycobacterium sp. PS03-16]|uniref:hypothetical protein n=1 Tax=Mycobacterium sp. PS03-16 TaxID=2559611 RepID=UPI0010749CC5|nr:hypothetical protein [Mycobacterium sp. PS03-16]TFV55055.1 hypothetical protein E4P42_23990 [Mycobacterium sp. PS03-16]